jgi:hypothetical protein
MMTFLYGIDMPRVTGQKTKVGTHEYSETEKADVINAFLEALSGSCNIGLSCRTAKISRTTIYRWKEECPDFAQAYARALKIGLTVLEDEAHRRAFNGYLDPVFYQGVKCGHVKKYSDTLAIVLLKSHDKEKYGNSDNLNIKQNINEMSDAELRDEIAKLLASGHLPKGSDE